MFHPDITKAQLAAHIESMTDVDFARFIYCQHMAATHLAIGQFEHMLIAAMLMCDRVKVRHILNNDTERWEQILQRQLFLQRSTLGSLINVMKSHDIAEFDVAYLRWLKGKRDYFVHRLFNDGTWPGDLDHDGCMAMTHCDPALAVAGREADLANL